MKRLSYFLVLPVFVLLVAFQNEKEGIIAVDVEYSDVGWTGYKVGGQHQGLIKVKEGTLKFKDGNLTGGQLVLDMATLSCSDIEEAEMNAKLVGHLKSADFFNVEMHPTATFKITKVVPYGKGEVEEEADYKLEIFKTTGELTIKGITKTIKTKVEVYSYDTSFSVAANLEIDRSDFDIQYGSGSFFEGLGDKLIYDEVELSINLTPSLSEE